GGGVGEGRLPHVCAQWRRANRNCRSSITYFSERGRCHSQNCVRAGKPRSASCTRRAPARKEPRAFHGTLPGCRPEPRGGIPCDKRQPERARSPCVGGGSERVKRTRFPLSCRRSGATSRARGMRILVLSPYVAWPLDGGPPIRIYYVLRELVRLGHEVVLLAGHDGPPLAATHPLHRLCREIVTYRPPESARSRIPLVSALRSLASPLPYVAAKFGARQIQESIQRIAEKHQFDLIWANFAF